MAKSVKINKRALKKLSKKPSLKDRFSKLLSFLKYNYRYNKKSLVLASISFVLFVSIVFIGVYNTFSRTGVNQNQVNGVTDKAENWYSKNYPLAKPEKTYNVWDGSVATGYAGGHGTKTDPYLISDASQLAYLSSVMHTATDMRLDSEELCIPDLDITYEYRTDASDVGEGDVLPDGTHMILSDFTLFVTNNSKAVITSFFISFRVDGIYVEPGEDIPAHYAFYSEGFFEDKDGNFTMPEEEFSYNGDRVTLRSRGFYLRPGTTNTIYFGVAVVRENTSDPTDGRYIFYDDENQEHYSEMDCFTTTYSKDKYFKLTDNIDMNGGNVKLGDGEFPFEGHFDGNFHSIKNLNVASNNNTQKFEDGLFNRTLDAEIKNTYLEDVTANVTSIYSNYVGGLVGYAEGESKIYNNGVDSGTITIGNVRNANSYVGGLVGYLTGTAVVANSYNNANIVSTATGNNNLKVGGVVGYRTGNNTSFDNRNPKVYSLVNYGDININSGDYQFVYNGTMFNSNESPTYSYYLFNNDKKDLNTTNANTYAIAKTEKELNSPGFVAHLNNYRYMTNYYLGFDKKIGASKESGYSNIALWKVKEEESLLPRFDHYTEKESKYMNFTTSEGEAINNFGSGNYLKVNLRNSVNNSVYTVYVKKTGKDGEKHDFINNKIVLPFNSASSRFTYSTNGLDGSGYEMIQTGWKLTSVVHNGSVINTQASATNINYNYALRSGTNGASKDINTIYAQGGYYLVPDGVTEVTFNTEWARAIYVRDKYDEIVYNNNYSVNETSSSKYSTAYTNGDGKTRNTPVVGLDQAYAKISAQGSSSYYNFAFVLVSNLHYFNSTVSIGTANQTNAWPYTGTNNVTIMSIDNDNDLRPDYTLYTRNHDVLEISGTRFDFINLLAIPQVGSVSSRLSKLRIKSGAIVELTETVTTDSVDLLVNNARSVKVNGGTLNIYANDTTTLGNTQADYIYFGGNAIADVVNFGSSNYESVAGNYRAPSFVINGGIIKTLSGSYRAKSVAINNKINFYVNGGYIDEFYTAYDANVNSSNIDINNSIINKYYSGGHASTTVISNGVYSSISNSVIDEVYGGSLFGRITNASTLNIDSSTINKVYGAGYGGTETIEYANLYKTYNDATNAYCSELGYAANGGVSLTFPNSNTTLSTSRNNNSRSYLLGRLYSSTYVETGFNADIYSISGCAIKSYNANYSALSISSVDRVRVNIINSTIKDDVYGGGNNGNVTNSVELNIDRTTVNGSVYGSSLKTEDHKVNVYENNTGYVQPNFISYSIDATAKYPTEVEYTWTSSNTGTTSSNYANKTNKTIYSPNLVNLGNTNGEVYVNITNSSIEGSVYGAGNNNKTNANIYLNLAGDNTVNGTVYGGSLNGSVTGNIDLRTVGGNYETIIGGADNGNIVGSTSVTLSDGTNASTVIGGSNSSNTTSTKVYVLNSAIENVYGGSLNAGDVDNSYVYLGVNNPTAQKFNPTYPSGIAPISDNKFNITRVNATNNKNNITVTNVYGGNELGGNTGTTNITVNGAVNVTNIYGGSNGANVTNSNITVENASGIANIYGGGYNDTTENSNINIKASAITDSVYGGSNGGGVLKRNTIINVSSTSIIENNIYGGGSGANVGYEDLNNSSTTINIYGGTVRNSIYGGSLNGIVYGTTNINIGATNSNYVSSNISVNNVISAGNLDDTYILDEGLSSVIGDSTINIKPNNYSISISGYVSGAKEDNYLGNSTIVVENIGTRDVPNKMISFERANKVLFKNSHVDLLGREDEGNFYTDVNYSFNRIDELISANSSTLYLRGLNNLVKSYSSVLINGNTIVNETVSVPANRKATSNVDNRLYLMYRLNFNILDSEVLENANYGNVSGMTFFGLFEQNRDGTYDRGIYNNSLGTGDTGTEKMSLLFIDGSQVIANHKNNHNYNVDGFYTNTMDDATFAIKTEIIKPTPDDENFYMWIVGEKSQTFTIDLVASKNAISGTQSFPLTSFNRPNTYFQVIDYNDSKIAEGIEFIEPENVPRVAVDENEALKTFGLRMHQSITGWKTDGETSFISKKNRAGYFEGTEKYYTAASDDTPYMNFQLVNSKNIDRNKDLGTAVIALRAFVPVNDVNISTLIIFFEVNMETNFFEGSSYDGNMIPGKKFDVDSTVKPTITSDSTLTAYYSFYLKKDTNPFTVGDYRVLSSSYKLPVGTQITMIDKSVEHDPKYYYYKITNENYNAEIVNSLSYNNNGISTQFYAYRLSNFIRMGSTSSGNHFDNEHANDVNYNRTTKIAAEEYIFMVDFHEAINVPDIENAELFLENREIDGAIVYNSDESNGTLLYSLYNNKHASIDIDIQKDRETVYVGEEFNLDLNFTFQQQKIGDITIFDTNYIQDNMGLKMSVFDSAGNRVPGTNLLGTVFYIEGEPYSAFLDGSVHMKISDLVTDVSENIRVDLSKSNLPTDRYRFVVEAFGSPDGKFFGLTNTSKSEFYIDIINELYGLSIDVDDENIILDTEGMNLKHSNILSFNINYKSQYSNPNIRLKLLRRNYNTVYSLDYDEVLFNDYFTNVYTINDENEVLLSSNPASNIPVNLNFKNNLMTGTYKLKAMLYDGDQFIGEVYTYFFVREEEANKNEIHVSTQAEFMNALNKLIPTSRNTIVLDDDISFDTNINLNFAGNLTIDFNNHIISANRLGQYVFLININAGENIVLKNTGGRTLSSNAAGILVTPSFTGNLVLDGFGLQSNGDVSFRSQSNSAKITINNSSLESTAFAGINLTGNSTLYVNDSTIKGINWCINMGNGTAYVNGGTYVGRNNLFNGANRITIYGGRFSHNVNPAPGYIVERDAENYYVVRQA